VQLRYLGFARFVHPVRAYSGSIASPARAATRRAPSTIQSSHGRRSYSQRRLRV
jgi:hypothetical protein